MQTYLIYKDDKYRKPIFVGKYTFSNSQYISDFIKENLGFDFYNYTWKKIDNSKRVSKTKTKMTKNTKTKMAKIKTAYSKKPSFTIRKKTTSGNVSVTKGWSKKGESKIVKTIGYKTSKYGGGKRKMTITTIKKITKR